MVSVKLLLLQKYDVFTDSTDEKQLETESNSTVDSNWDFTAFADAEKTLYRQVITRRCVTMNSKLLTLDDVCAVINRTVITVMSSVKHNDVSTSVTDCYIRYKRIVSFYYSVPLRACS